MSPELTNQMPVPVPQELTHAAVFEEYAKNPDANAELVSIMRGLAAQEATTVAAVEADVAAREADEMVVPRHEISLEHHEEHIALVEPAVPDIRERSEAEQDLVGEVFELGEVAIDGPDSPSVGSAEIGEENLLITQEAMISEMAGRLELPHNQRSGTEVILGDGERLRPCFDLELNTHTQELVRDAIESRRGAMTEALHFLESITEASNEDRTRLMAMLQPTVVPQSMYYEMSGGPQGSNRIDTKSGTLVDLFIGPEDLAVQAELAARIDALFPTTWKDMPPASELIGLTLEAVGKRAVDYARTLIPEGVPLAHTVYEKNLINIIANGKMVPRYMIDTSTSRSSRVSNNGSHTNLVHFAEPGKVNAGYGDCIILLPIEKIVAQSPYHMAEEAYVNKGDPIQEPMAPVTFDIAKAPLALRYRLAQLYDRFAQGFVVETTQGGSNNLSFAASGDRAAAGKYEYSIDDMQVIVPAGPAKSVNFTEFWQDFAPDKQAWVDTHMRQQSNSGVLGQGYNQISRLGLDVVDIPPSLEIREGKVTAYGFVNQQRVAFSERQMQFGVKLHKPAVEDAYGSFQARKQQEKADEAARRRQAEQERDRLVAEAEGITLEEYRQRQFDEIKRQIDSGELIM